VRAGGHDVGPASVPATDYGIAVLLLALTEGSVERALVVKRSSVCCVLFLFYNLKQRESILGRTPALGSHLIYS
jgi:hypothetical protein